MSKINNSRVQSNLLQQNCFVRESVRSSDLVNSSSPEVFLSLDEVVTSKGVNLVQDEFPYPITPQYVNSFVDMADYRNDPFGSVSSSVRRSNLGDIRDVQRLSELDTESARILFDELKARFELSSNSVEGSIEKPIEGGGNE